MKKAKAFIVLAFAAAVMVCFCASAGAIDESGYCGYSVIYTYNSSEKTVYISGEGEITSYADYTKSPFYDIGDGLERVVIEQGVTAVGDYAFYGCEQLKEVSLPEGITVVGDFSFGCCSSLDKITLPEGLELIGAGAFSGCGALTGLTVPASVTFVPGNAFYGCGGLESITFKGEVSSIGSSAFKNCTGLKSITLQEGLTSVDTAAFEGCTSLKEVYFGGDDIQWSFVSVGYNNKPLGEAAVYYRHACPHTMDKWKTCEDGTHTRYCLNEYPCPYVEKESCDFGKWTVLKEATLNENGERERICSVCGYVEKAEYSHSPLDAVKENIVEATCEDDGSYDSVIYCSVCDKELKRDFVVVEASGHKADNPVTENYISATCESDGGYDSVTYCSVCDKELKRDFVVVEASGHKADNPVTENYIGATCESDGSYDSVIYCSVCDTELKREFVVLETSGHKADNPVTENYISATCESDGGYDSVTYCYVCGVELSRKHYVIYGGHKWEFTGKNLSPDCATPSETFYVCLNNSNHTKCVSGETNKNVHAGGTYILYALEPTCTKEGHTGVTVCRGCETKLDYGEQIKPTGHQNVEILPAVKASCTSHGLTEGKKCLDCGKIFVSQSVVEATGHSYSDSCDKSCNTCGASRNVSHTYKTATTKATLKKNGKQVTRCTVCGDIKSSKTIYYPKSVKLSTSTYTYNGKTKTPSVVVKDSKGNTLKKDTDYTVKYASGRKNPGKYTVTVTFKGKYSGTKKLTLTIKPKAPSITDIYSKTKGKAVIKWSNVAGESGYELYYATSKDGTYKKVNSYKANKLAGSRTKLRSGNRYYFKVRACKKTSSGTVYSSWSKVKSVKIR